jgi:hypothetical protein
LQALDFAHERVGPAATDTGESSAMCDEKI